MGASPVPSLCFPGGLSVRRQGDDRARQQSGGLIRFVPVGQFSQGQVEYHVYSNTGVDDPINYDLPIATVTATTWTLGGLARPGDWKFGVRAFWSSSGLEEQNLDCAVAIILDAFGNDITYRPAPPTGLRAFATAGGGITAEWYYPPVRTPANAIIAGRGVPTGFHIYVGVGGTPNYTTPAATVLYSSGFAGTFQANLSGLSDGTAYTIGVRAYNASAEEPNTTTVTVIADATGPTPVVGLTATAIV